jgi:GT2 family glycosyltransferase
MAEFPRIRFVVATREDRDAFFARTATGRSLALYRFPFVELNLCERNTEGLPRFYNRAIETAAKNPAILVFIHDDVHLCDFYWANRISNALRHFQIVGVAGNKRRVARQPSWAFSDECFTWDAPENLSGVVAHGTGFPPHNLSAFGPPAQQVKLLDGVLLISESRTLIEHNLRFDERFSFHFYDLDFCRQAESKNLKMGTWPLSIVHESGGRFGSDAWKLAYQSYLEKWSN